MVAQFAELALLVGGELFELAQLQAVLAVEHDEDEQADGGGQKKPVCGGQGVDKVLAVFTMRYYAAHARFFHDFPFTPRAGQALVDV